MAIEKGSLTELQASIEALLGRIEANKTDDLNRLIDFYKNMKPADAARIMDDLDIETTVMVLGTMNPRSCGPDPCQGFTGAGASGVKDHSGTVTIAG